MRNSSLPGFRISYSVQASCVNRRVSGGVGCSDPSGLAPPGNGLSPRPRCCAAINAGTAAASANANNAEAVG